MSKSLGELLQEKLREKNGRPMSKTVRETMEAFVEYADRNGPKNVPVQPNITASGAGLTEEMRQKRLRDMATTGGTGKWRRDDYSSEWKWVNGKLTKEMSHTNDTLQLAIYKGRRGGVTGMTMDHYLRTYAKPVNCKCSLEGPDQVTYGGSESNSSSITSSTTAVKPQGEMMDHSATQQMMAAIISLADTGLDDDLKKYDVGIGGLGIEIANELKERNAAKLKRAAGHIANLIDGQEEAVQRTVNSIRMLRREVAEKKMHLEKLSRALAYGSSTNNFVPLAILIGTGSSFALDEKLTKVPDAFVVPEPKAAEATPTVTEAKK